MTYDVIEPKPDPSTLAIDPEDHRAAVRQFTNAREAIVEAVREYTEVVEDTDVRYRIRAVVPYRVTAYRHDFDDDAVDELKSKYGRTPPGEPTDGFVDVSDGESTTYRSIPHTHNQEFPVTYGEREPEHTRDMHRRQGHEALEASVVSTVEDGEVSVPITKTVLDVVEDEPETPTFHESKPEPKPLDYETEDRTLTIGTATYKVDAIVPPEEWDTDE